ncbi:MAG: hypothetical protein AB1730_11135 [Myxococcota bacterium]|jgi:hypothetical protein
MTVSLLALCLAAAPQRYLLTVGGAPMAELRVEVDGRSYRYASTHFLEEGPAERQLAFTLDEAGQVHGLVPEVLALARLPAKGCTEVLEEVRRAPERLCIDSVRGRAVTGTLAGKAFSATYDARGALASLTLGAARWDATRTPATAPPPDANPFTRGFPVEGEAGVAQLVPNLPGVRRLSTPPEGGADEATVGRARCLVAARQAVTQTPGATLVLGLVVEGGRAWPHAWVRVQGRDVDPSVLPGDTALETRQYLALPDGAAGRVYLELLDGTRTVQLTPGAPPKK